MKKRATSLLNKKNTGLVIIIVFVVCFLVFKFIDNKNTVSAYVPVKPKAKHSSGQHFSGSAVCTECHLEIYNSHIETAHYKSSEKANINSVKGSFKFDKNIFNLNDSIEFRMELRNGFLYQDVFFKPNNLLIDSSRFDVVIGSGTKGQSYLNWQDSSLYQLQISYFTPNKSWVSSPGHSSNKLASKRPILGRCLECHVTYAKNTKNFNKRNTYTKSQIMYGIDCERCHGPSHDHVNFHRKNPLDTIAMKIVAFSNLSKQQKLDVCALCHSGIGAQNNKNAFSFVVGDTLSQFSTPDYDEKSIENLDVHGNQYGLLLASKCFKKSKYMDCTTCHSPHKNERNDHISFNNRCQSCHNTSENHTIICSEAKEAKEIVGNNCIQCHMPLISSKIMQIKSSKDTLKPVEVRTHFIGIYSDSLMLPNLQSRIKSSK